MLLADYSILTQSLENLKIELYKVKFNELKMEFNYKITFSLALLFCL